MVATTLSSQVLIRIAAQLAATVGLSDFTDAGAPPVASKTDFANGTGSGQADVVWSSKGRSLAQGLTENLDLNGGALVDAFGNAVVFATIKAIYIKQKTGAAGTTLVIGGVAAVVPIFGATTHTLAIGPGDEICLKRDPGIVVTASTGDLLRFTSGSTTLGTLTYDILIIGTSA
jgi:hypothetical protein